MTGGPVPDLEGPPAAEGPVTVSESPPVTESPVPGLEGALADKEFESPGPSAAVSRRASSTESATEDSVSSPSHTEWHASLEAHLRTESFYLTDFLVKPCP